jgi:hypothetical protein
MRLYSLFRRITPSRMQTITLFSRKMFKTALDTECKRFCGGKSMNWETVVYDVTPISYAQSGLYRQFVKRRGFDLKFLKTPF